MQKIKVTYADGREVEAKASPKAKLRAEEHCNGVRGERYLLFSFYLAWASLHLSGQESADFDTWLDLVEDVEDVEEKADPTPPAQSDAGLSD